MEKFNSLEISVNKKALLVGAGKWGEKIAKVLLRQNYEVKYVTRNNNQNIDFESKIRSKLLSHFLYDQENFFDLVVIAVRPIDFYSAWSKYKSYSNRFLIEKPGASSRDEINLIFSEAYAENKLVLINYEYIYTGESLLLRAKLNKKEEFIKEISIIWEKKLFFKGGLEWRILPHLIAEILVISRNDFYINSTQLTDEKIQIRGKLKNANLKIEFNDSDLFKYRSKIKLFDNQVFIQERNKLIHNNNIIYNQEKLSVDHMVNLCKTASSEIFMDNNNLASEILKTIDNINV